MAQLLVLPSDNEKVLISDHWNLGDEKVVIFRSLKPFYFSICNLWCLHTHSRSENCDVYILTSDLRIMIRNLWIPMCKLWCVIFAFRSGNCDSYLMIYDLQIVMRTFWFPICKLWSFSISTPVPNWKWIETKSETKMIKSSRRRRCFIYFYSKILLNYTGGGPDGNQRCQAVLRRWSDGGLVGAGGGPMGVCWIIKI